MRPFNVLQESIIVIKFNSGWLYSGKETGWLRLVTSRKTSSKLLNKTSQRWCQIRRKWFILFGIFLKISLFKNVKYPLILFSSYFKDSVNFRSFYLCRVYLMHRSTYLPILTYWSWVLEYFIRRFPSKSTYGVHLTYHIKFFIK